MTGLVINDPWICLILSGQKVWEIRGSRTKIRGRIALIKSKSGTIVGTCELDDCIGPLSLDDYHAAQSKHQIPPDMLEGLPYPNTYAWVLKDARPLPEPIPYRHPSGAVIWVTLTDQNVSDFALLTTAGNASADQQPVREALPAQSSGPSFAIVLPDGTEVLPCLIRDNPSGGLVYKLSDAGNTNREAVCVTVESEMRRRVEVQGFRVRCKSRDGQRSGLYSGQSPNRIRNL